MIHFQKILPSAQPMSLCSLTVASDPKCEKPKSIISNLEKENSFINHLVNGVTREWCYPAFQVGDPKLGYNSFVPFWSEIGYLFFELAQCSRYFP